MSDLDGTLLNSASEISEKSAHILNHLTQNGVFFSVATARNIGTAFDKVRSLRLSAPMSLMNGVLIYEQDNPKPVNITSLPYEMVRDFLYDAQKFSIPPIFFLYDDEKNLIERRCEDAATKKRLYAQRNQPYIKISDSAVLAGIDNKIPIYICFLDEFDNLLPIQDLVKNYPKLRSVFYYDRFLKKWYLEIFSIQAGKGAGVKRIAQMIGAEKIICFGDNANDLPMFEIADEKYATANAPEEIQKAADGVIASCDEDAVANFLCQRFQFLF